ncbi:putative phage Integrase [uncultured Mycobacterium sp.]|uniref:Putative phage Integrase n=1 Tax=uncultured Mycobacterium sp. TaxID=171292 RepID=A0A1Y5PHL8_9MYCO|nr:putative phage Integrase [uncultured Mycobacterium sp.]
MGNYLGRVRLSVHTDESTSVERQREHIEQWAKMHGHTIVGWAEDIDVSGKLSPFDTPQFGDWLNNRWPEFDGIVAWKLDRLARNTFGLHKLFEWAHERGKTVATIEDSIDLSGPMGRAIAGFLAAIAEMELQNISTRVTDSHRHLRSVGRWGTGTPPYGYRAVKNGDGCRLDIDPKAAKVVRGAVADVLDGVPLAHIARRLEREKTPAPRGGAKWGSTTLRGILMSRALLGEYSRGDLGPDGKPVKVGPELIDLETFDRVRAILDGNTGVGTRRDAAPLSGLVKCECGAPLWADTRTSRGKKYRYYRAECEHPVTMRAEFLEGAAEATLLHFYGDKEIEERQWVAGEDHTTALADAVRRAGALAEQVGRTTSPTMAGVLQGQLDAVAGEIANLEARPQVEGHWEMVGTGVTWAQKWHGATADERRKMLRDGGIEFHVGINDKGEKVVSIPKRFDRTAVVRQRFSV